MAPSQQWKWWRKQSDGWLAVKICIPELSSDNCACDTTQYILSNIYDFTLFILSMTVILIAVYAVVLVLLKDQWWYIWAVRAMNQEVVEVWVAAQHCAPKWGLKAQVPLEEQRWTWPREAFCSVFQYKTTALCCWYSFPFHLSYLILCNLGKLKWKWANVSKNDSHWSWDWIFIALIRATSQCLLNICAKMLHCNMCPTVICAGKVWI